MEYEDMTNWQQLLELVPDFEERLKNAPKELKEAINKRHQHHDGWRPLEWMKGFM